MPTRIDWAPFDAANAASKLPEPLQKPAGVAMQLIKDYFGGDDPMAQMVPAVGMVGTSELTGRGALKEALKIIKDYSSDMDPLKAALAQRATPSRVFHRTPINVPSGFELPKEFGPNYTTRPESMIDTFLTQKAAPLPEPKVALRASSPLNTGAAKSSAKLTDLQVKAIREMINNGGSKSDIARQYGVHNSTIAGLMTGGYKWVK